ncbi:hypothetical protein BJ165DRAFT_789224 [Panaeolus papilionaceus]|nr:hypothetical protein BJ165DRAFT_789224 [Panaeolus papilionaceus]
MDFFCLPVICGCQSKITPEGDLTPRVCPRCHNAAVTSAKAKEYFELCFVPVFPMSSKSVWVCSICSWSVANQGGWEPQAVSSFGYQNPQGGGYYPPQPPPTWQGSGPVQQQYGHPQYAQQGYVGSQQGGYRM